VVKIEDFMRLYKVRAKVEPSEKWNEREEWFPNGRHFTVTMTCEGRKMKVKFSKGMLSTGDPTAREVLECLLLDWSIFDSCADVDEFAEEFGVAKPSVAIRQWEGLRNQAFRLDRWLPVDASSIEC
jgi:hypothetical protein